MEKLFGLIGHPVGHSMSPLMHNDAFNQLGIDGHYHAFDIEEGDLKEAIAAFKVLNVSGFNVTIPHKVKVMEFLDEIDEEAKMIGAVNTVVNNNGRLIGYNTDGRGYLSSLLTVIQKPILESNVLVIGAGGASRAVVTAICDHGVKKLALTNRTLEKAKEIKNNYNNYNKCNNTSMDIVSLKEAEANIEVYDIIINTTSIGMSPNVEGIPIAVDHIKRNVVLSDLIYNPLKTRWLQLGEEKGAIIHNGVGMFAMQGALAFHKWTGIEPDTKRMMNKVITQLGGTSC
ncbi:shikimate dehydrogenase [Anaerobacillus arseniciselenatis]|nr:shikimate dehydrogenase [Anaerobacillus arseniciselenatis]